MISTIVIDYYDKLAGIFLLRGRQGKFWEFYETDPNWWLLRLLLRSN